MDIKGKKSAFRISIRIYALILIGAGIGHGVWYWFFPHYQEMIGLTKIQWDTFNLFDWSVAILLTFLGILSNVVSKTNELEEKRLRVYSALNISLWVCRLVLEFLYPVQIPFIVISNPTTIIRLLIATILVVLVVPEIQYRTRQTSNHV